MANGYYNNDGTTLSRNSLARAAQVNAQLQAIAAGFDKLPTEAQLKQGAANVAASVGGTASAITLTMTYPISSYTDGMLLRFRGGAANTGAATVNVDGVGVVALKRQDGSDVVAGDIPSGGDVQIVYNSTAGHFRLAGAQAGDLAQAQAAASTATTQAGIATGAASTATTQAGEAADSATAALGFRNEAQAAAAGVNLPALSAGQQSKVLRPKSDGTGYELQDTNAGAGTVVALDGGGALPAVSGANLTGIDKFEVGDVIETYRTPPANFLACDGSIYLQSAYPALYGLVGLLIDQMPPVKITDPATLPAGSGVGVAWSPDGRYLAVGHETSPYLTIYDWQSGSPVKITDPGTIPTGIGTALAWSPDGRYLAVPHATSPFVTIYDWNTGSPVKIANPATLPPSNAECAGWSPDGRYLAVGHSVSPYLTIYDWNTGSPVKIANPATLPTNLVRGVAWSPDGRFLACAHDDSPYLTIYDWSTGSPVKIANPATLPTNAAASCAASPDGRYLAVGHSSSPFVTIYDWSTGSPVKIANPVDLPAGQVLGCGWSADSRYLALGINSDGNEMAIYDFAGAAPIKLGNPATMPAGSFAKGASWSPATPYLAVAHGVSPRVSIYLAASYDLDTEFAVPAISAAGGSAAYIKGEE